MINTWMYVNCYANDLHWTSQNQQYDQYTYPSLCEHIQYKQTCLQHIHINGNQCILTNMIIIIDV
jgi:hypothetical protein